ncbi:hypothetical protein GYH30_024910 [Glycine max]|nr:hypothetical protein GYH30_024910 [Glycine max]
MNTSSSWSTHATRQPVMWRHEAKREKKENHFDYDVNAATAANGSKLTVLKSPTGREIEACYELGRELGHGELGITYLCTDKETGEELACM